MPRNLFRKNYSKLLLPFLALIAFTQISAQDRDISKLSSGGKLHPLQANMDIRHYTLSLSVDITTHLIKGYTEVEMILAKKTDTILLDLINHYSVSAITINGEKAAFEHVNHKLFITSSSVSLLGKVVVRINYSGEPPVAARPPWLGGFTWTQDRSGNPWVAINCQKEGGRIFFPCKDHPSD